LAIDNVVRLQEQLLALQAERDRLLEALRDLIGEPSRMLTRPRSDSEEVPIKWSRIRKARAAVAAAKKGEE
jgi:hypothetical protein